MNANSERVDALCRIVIGRALVISNGLGAGFLEKPYENALAHEIRKAGLTVRQQQPIKVHWDGVLIGSYAADLVVEGVRLVELKTVRALDQSHRAQCINDLKATNSRLCLLLNFGNPRLHIQRVVNGL